MPVVRFPKCIQLTDGRSCLQAVYADDGIVRDFHVSQEVAILGVTLFILGLGQGPLFVGPLSEVYGRNIVYQTSFSIFFALSFPVAFAPDMGELLYDRMFLTEHKS